MHEKNNLPDQDSQLVDLVSSVLVNPTIHTDTRMRIHHQIAALLDEARPGGRPAADRDRDAQSLAAGTAHVLESVLSDPSLHTDMRMRLYHEISQMLSADTRHPGR